MKTPRIFLTTALIVPFATLMSVRAMQMPDDAVFANASQTNGTVIVNNEYSQGQWVEVGYMLFDKNTGTKWNQQSTSGWAAYQFADGDRWALTEYTLISANDNAPRDPREWYIEGTNDDLSDGSRVTAANADWTVVDYQARGGNFPGFYYPLTFPVADCGLYSAYRLRIVRNGGGDCVQLSEWNMKGRDHTVADITHNSAAVSGRVINDGAPDDFDIWIFCDTTDHEDDLIAWQGADFATQLEAGFEFAGSYWFDDIVCAGLMQLTGYTARVCAVGANNPVVLWSDPIGFTTISPVTTLEATDLTYQSAIVWGDLADDYPTPCDAV
ncbi:MAG: hypothetical protein FWG05_01855, partial [Kiritimatiellaeota bacterium]|nr:hypothetical protein [Kiritimatiellota bacterium]